MSRRPSRFAGFNARSVAFWLLAAVLASVAVWLLPSAPPRPPTRSSDLVFFDIVEDAAVAPPGDAGLAPHAFPAATEP